MSVPHSFLSDDLRPQNSCACPLAGASRAHSPHTPHEVSSVERDAHAWAQAHTAHTHRQAQTANTHAQTQYPDARMHTHRPASDPCTWAFTGMRKAYMNSHTCMHTHMRMCTAATHACMDTRRTDTQVCALASTHARMDTCRTDARRMLTWPETPVTLGHKP